MYQVWRFIAPGLYAKEKKLVVPFVVLTTFGSIGAATCRSGAAHQPQALLELLAVLSEASRRFER
jgi:sec-independent protein translocase protein TatC